VARRIEQARGTGLSRYVAFGAALLGTGSLIAGGYGRTMRTRCGVIAAGAVLVMAGLAGCASAPGGSPAPTSSPAADEDAVTPEPEFTPTPDPVADARVQGWLDSLAVPPTAQRADESPSEAFGRISTGWLCTPTVVKDAYWVVDGMNLTQTTRWMLKHPVAGLFSSLSEPISDSQAAPGDVTSFALTPQQNDPFQGIFVVIAQTAQGAAIHAQSGTYPESATCPTPEPGTAFGGLGQG
jgi:hypothetical protein